MAAADYTTPVSPVTYCRKEGLGTTKELVEMKKEHPTDYATLMEYAVAEMNILGVPVKAA